MPERARLTVALDEATKLIGNEIAKWNELARADAASREDFEQLDARETKARRYTSDLLKSLFNSDRPANEFGTFLGRSRHGRETVEELLRDHREVCRGCITDLESLQERLPFFTGPDDGSMSRENPSPNRAPPRNLGFQAAVLRVLIASPGDVGVERDAVEAAIHGWNKQHTEDLGVMLLPRRWETDTVPEMGDRAQAIVNRQIVDNCDLLLGIFGARIGTPTGQAQSGTVEEIERCIDASKRVMLYFSEAPVPRHALDTVQFEALEQFRKTCQSRGLTDTFQSSDELAQKVVRHLTAVARQCRTAAAAEAQEKPPEDPLGDIRSAVISILIKIMLLEDEFQERDFDPWLEQWRSDWSRYADELWRFAADDKTRDAGLSDRLQSLADALDVTAHFRLYLGCGGALKASADKVFALSQEVHRHLAAGVPISDTSLSEGADMLRKAFRELSALAERAEAWVDQGRLEEVQNQASDWGYRLLQLAYYDIDRIIPGRREQLKLIARKLHLLETQRIYMDGGVSIERCLSELKESASRLGEIVRVISE